MHCKCETECGQCVRMNSLIQRGPTTFYQRAIVQKRDNLRAISVPLKCCIKQQIHNIEKWKRETTWVRHWNCYTITIYYKSLSVGCLCPVVEVSLTSSAASPKIGGVQNVW